MQLDNNSIKAVRCILWAGLIHEDPDLTEQQVGNLIDIQYMQELMASLGEAFDADMPEPEKLPETAEPKLDGAQGPNAQIPAIKMGPIRSVQMTGIGPIFYMLGEFGCITQMKK